MSATREYRKGINFYLHRLELAQTKASQEKEALDQINQSLDALEEARAIARAVAEGLQKTAHGKIASLVTRCLEAVFDDPYEFKIDFEQKRGKTEASLIFTREGKTYSDPLNEVGGGVIDVASLALRLACVLLSKPKQRKLLVLDEPFRNVRGKHNRQRLRSLLQALADEMDFQFIINVDADAYPEFTLGKVIEL